MEAYYLSRLYEHYKARVLAAISGVVVLACLWFLFAWISFLRTPLITEDQGYKYDIPSGASMRFVANDLYLLNIIKHPFFFNLLIKLKGSESQLKAGEYLFPKGVTPSRLLDQITTGTGLVYHSFTIVAGWNFHHLRRALAAQKDLLHTSSALTDAEIMAALGHPELKPEGLFFQILTFLLKVLLILHY